MSNCHLHVLKKREISWQGPVYAERQHQCCSVASSITLIKLLRYLGKPRKSLKNGFQPPLIIDLYVANIDADARSKSLALNVDGP